MRSSISTDLGAKLGAAVDCSSLVNKLEEEQRIDTITAFLRNCSRMAPNQAALIVSMLDKATLAEKAVRGMKLFSTTHLLLALLEVESQIQCDGTTPITADFIAHLDFERIHEQVEREAHPGFTAVFLWSVLTCNGAEKVQGLLRVLDRERIVKRIGGIRDLPPYENVTGVDRKEMVRAWLNRLSGFSALMLAAAQVNQSWVRHTLDNVEKVYASLERSVAVSPDDDFWDHICSEAPVPELAWFAREAGRCNWNMSERIAEAVANRCVGDATNEQEMSPSAIGWSLWSISTVTECKGIAQHAAEQVCVQTPLERATVLALAKDSVGDSASVVALLLLSGQEISPEFCEELYLVASSNNPSDEYLNWLEWAIADANPKLAEKRGWTTGQSWSDRIVWDRCRRWFKVDKFDEV